MRTTYRNICSGIKPATLGDVANAVDKIGMAHSIEARVPFLDHRIVEFTMSILQNMKMPDMKTTKYLLKKAVEPILPHDIIPTDASRALPHR